jgi:hypothetical protein
MTKTRYAGFILAWDLKASTKVAAILATEALGFVVTVTFGVYWCRKMNERKLREENQMIEQYTNDEDGSDESIHDDAHLLLPPEALTRSGQLRLEGYADQRMENKNKTN